MAYGQNQIEPDQRASDAFGRLRVSEPQTLFNVSFQYDAQPLLMQVLNVGSGTGVKTANVSSVTLSTGGTTSTWGSILQSHGYYRYEPGKSQLIQMTGVIGAYAQSVRKQIGYYDINDGVFFDMDGTTQGASGKIAVTLRTSTSGSPVDTAVLQTAWNLDKMDGTGPSGVTLDFTKEQLFLIDLQWLSVGRIRFGFNLGGQIIYCHQILNANIIALPYMNTANLPLRWEIHNTGTAGGTNTLTAICGSIISEGGAESPQALSFTCGNGITGIAVTTRRAVLTIRPKTTFNSITNRTRVTPYEVEVSTAGNAALIELVYNGTLGGSPSYASADANSSVEFDIAGTTVTGGTTVYSFYVGTTGAARVQDVRSLLNKLVLGLDIAGTGQDTFSVVATSFTGTATVSAQMNWFSER